ncbi:uncharacterized protein LOC113504248 isoform X2 [Trichoplusia ni]|uniref:Uncharacterized protein LOC113504248 isoform X2 n=1 Tax=Trichoplusia ni TaxID=7111 RepID=A0A7E5WNJ8_TRINI|nr:uncharacterized protein LOC113504248 isoform X2 [Trichoplusia ni]
MVKLLGINCKIIITILYLHYLDSEAGGAKMRRAPELEVWQSNPEFDFRRAATTKNMKNAKTTKQVTQKTGKASIKIKGHEVDNRNKLHNDQGLSIVNVHNSKNQNNNDKQNKNKFSKDKITNLREKGQNKKPDLSVKTTSAKPVVNESIWPMHHHRSKLRTHDEQHELRSTRMTPMYLMQQPADEDDKKKEDDEDAPQFLSPFSVAAQMRRLMEDFPEANATIDVLDRTVEYNDLVIVKMTESKSDGNKFFRAAESKYMDEVPEKKIIFIVHGLSVMGIKNLPCMGHTASLKKLISYYVKHLKLFDIFLMPMANPDGYAAIHANQIWNKNMSPQDACPGVALDRNFDVAWNNSKKVSSCSQLFPGKTAFSETEARAIRDVFHFHGHKIIAYIHVHAGTYDVSVFKGDAVLYPKGYTEVQSDDDKYIDLKGEIDEAMKNASFQVLSVTVDTLNNWYGKISGSSVDYAATVYGIPYALEFVMQLYLGDVEPEGHMQLALNEVWSRIISTCFRNMYRSLRANEVQKKK